MKHCPKCGLFYASSLPVCPRCGIDEQAAKEESTRPSKPKEAGRSWLIIALGIPLLILILYYICGRIMAPLR